MIAHTDLYLVAVGGSKNHLPMLCLKRCARERAYDELCFSDTSPCR